MPVAAVPNYLGKDFSTASPGMRFGIFLPIWTDRQDQEREVKNRADKKSREGREIQQYLDANGMDATIDWLRQRDRNPLPGRWKKNEYAASKAWRNICELTPTDQQTQAALIDRQMAMAMTFESSDLLTVAAKSIAPFSTGLGNEHPLENGFAFLWPYGLPYLPGSGVKGVLRQAARELAGLVEDVSWDDNYGWNENAIEALFGRENEEGEQDHCRGVLSFWDVIPKIKGGQLTVEIMTPHQKHYYQDGQSPHDSGQPTPITFLTVPPKSNFSFHVHCDRNRLQQLAPDLARNDRWKNLLESAFQHAFDWLGFGAKTAVGYGAMEIDAMAELRAKQAAKAAEEEKMLPEARQIHELRETLEREKAAGKLSPNGEVANQRVNLLRFALEWEDSELRQEAANLIQETLKYLKWSKKSKKERQEDLAKLQGNK
ncbi:type III-B CRISPR module RAMP protein Cmr6 [Methylohalobius crimeensis]|uniref:type III-B CRISPR module RAMP protein Cmr6 n=1 Tax=Methylohalobius crimeensis TaxID=244365 RepID=UPI0003B49EC2|nr:type III-B CRISPR module RAMP protein Cmr6 [Methylohalobius crimeensis]